MWETRETLIHDMDIRRHHPYTKDIKPVASPIVHPEATVIHHAHQL